MMFGLLAVAVLGAGCGCNREQPDGVATPVTNSTPQTEQTTEPTASTGGVALPPYSGQKTSAIIKPPIDPYRGLVPLEGLDPPAISLVQRATIYTEAGNLEVELYPQIAPNAVERFTTLVEEKFYDGVYFHQVPPNRTVAKFGINPTPRYERWKDRFFGHDDPRFRLTQGTLAFTGGRKFGNSTHIFLNLQDNSQWIENGLCVFGQVVDGMRTVQAFRKVYVEDTGNWDDYKAKIEKLPEAARPTRIKRIRIKR